MRRSSVLLKPCVAPRSEVSGAGEVPTGTRSMYTWFSRHKSPPPSPICSSARSVKQRREKRLLSATTPAI
eukprot:2515570-Prymnesium_polylepis.1